MVLLRAITWLLMVEPLIIHPVPSIWSTIPGAHQVPCLPTRHFASEIAAGPRPVRLHAAGGGDLEAQHSAEADLWKKGTAARHDSEMAPGHSAACWGILLGHHWRMVVNPLMLREPMQGIPLLLIYEHTQSTGAMTHLLMRELPRVPFWEHRTCCYTTLKITRFRMC